MGWTSTDNYMDKTTNDAQFERSDFVKVCGTGTWTAGRWYDLQYADGTPPAMLHGDYAANGGFWGSDVGWTHTSGTRFYFTPATGLMTKAIGGGTGIPSNMSQNTDCVSGTEYVLGYTIGGYQGFGNIYLSLGGTLSTPRTTAATFRENIVCGAAPNAPLCISGLPYTGFTIDNVFVTRPLRFKPYRQIDNTQNTFLWKGNFVTPTTKHVTAAGAWTGTATGAPSILMVVDLLGCYPRINLASSAPQYLLNEVPLPRYASGTGVMAFLSVAEAPGAGAQYTSMYYTNHLGVEGRNLGAVVANTASALQSHITHAGVAAGNYGPFLPTGFGEGIRSVQSVTFSAAAAAGSGAIANLVLCKPICTIPLTAAYVVAERELLSQIPGAPRVLDDACLGFIYFAGANTAAATTVQGFVNFSWA